MSNLNELVSLISKWGADRNITTMDSLDRQYMKLVSEFGEIGTAIINSDKTLVIDALGDSFVVLVLLAKICDFDLMSERRPQYQSARVPYGLQVESALETLGLLSDAVAKRHFERVEDLSKHLLTHIELIAQSFNLTVYECVHAAYHEIKDRKGVMYGGTFIKSTDERYAAIMAELGLPA